MILEPGACVLVSHRHLYEGDRPRFFVGRVDAYEAPVARITGYTWVQDNFTGQFIGKRESLRTKLISLSSGTVIVYALPVINPLESIRFENDEQGRLWCTDGGSFRLEMTEGVHARLPR